MLTFLACFFWIENSSWLRFSKRDLSWFNQSQAQKLLQWNVQECTLLPLFQVPKWFDEMFKRMKMFLHWTWEWFYQLSYGCCFSQGRVQFFAVGLCRDLTMRSRHDALYTPLKFLSYHRRPNCWHTLSFSIH